MIDQQEPKQDKQEKRIPRLTWVIVGVLVILFAQMAYAQWQTEQTSRERATSIRCLSEWSVDFANALDARTSRSSTTTQARDEMDAAIADVFNATRTVLGSNASRADLDALNAALERHRKAYAAVSKAVEAQTDATQNNPYPPPPSGCIE